MPSGVYLSQEVRELVWAHVNLFHRTPEQIWKDIFFCTRASLPYVERMCCDAAKNGSANAFMDPTTTRSGGPKKKMSVNATAALLAILRKNPEKSQVKVLAEMSRDYYGTQFGLPHQSTVCRELQRNFFSRKVLEHRHIRRNPVLRAKFLERVGPYEHTRLVDIDETLSTAKEFNQRYGYAAVGDVAFKTQFTVNGKHYSSVVMYSPMGVLAYRVKEGIFDADEFESFLENEVAAALLPGAFGLFDNAAIHKTTEVRNALERVFNGRYTFCAPYSPDFKPVERLFAMVKTILRDREDEAALDPFNAIKAIFDSFRPGGPLAHHANNHFRMYSDNHNAWLNF